MDFTKEKEETAYFMRRLYDQKLTTTSGGNVSLRVDDTVLITPSQLDKGRIKAGEIGIITLDGENLTPHLKISMESKMHLAIYHNRNDVKAIVHAHPVFATSFAIAGKEIKTNLAGEAWAVLGKAVFAPYALMGSQNLADNVGAAALIGNCILMENHGILCVGENLLQAFDRLEVLEAAAKMNLITQLLGNSKELSPEELKEISLLFE
jgi:L-fuculose-phosphate aldolase